MNIEKRYRVTREAISILMVAALHVGASRADIFQWEYVDPADPSQGKRPSATLCPDGAGVAAAPGVDLSYRNLARAYLFRADLSGAFLYEATLTGAYLSQGDLTNAQFALSTLTGADLTDAVVVGASFGEPSSGAVSIGFTQEQLYSTASYKNHDLSGIGLYGTHLTGWNFAGQNLTNAEFGWSWLNDADLTDAIVVGTRFWGATARGFTKEQMYSTASYKNRDLAGIHLGENDLTGWNLVGQNLTNAEFYYLIGVDQSLPPTSTSCPLRWPMLI